MSKRRKRPPKYMHMVTYLVRVRDRDRARVRVGVRIGVLARVVGVGHVRWQHGVGRLHGRHEGGHPVGEADAWLGLGLGLELGLG